MGSLITQRIWANIKGRTDLENANRQSSLIHGSCLILFHFFKRKKIKYLFLLEFFFFLHIYLHPSLGWSQQGSTELPEEVVVTSDICTCSSEGREVWIFKTAGPLVGDHLNWCVLPGLLRSPWCWLVHFGPIVCQWTRPSPVSFAASNHWRGGSSAKQTSAPNKRPIFFFFFLLCIVLMKHRKVSLTQCLSRSSTACAFAECMSVKLKINVGNHVF